MKNSLFAILTVAVLSSGCSSMFNPGSASSDFDCPGMPKGVVCKTPREVYKLTNGENSSVTAANLKQTLPNNRIVEPKNKKDEVIGPAFVQSDGGIQPEPLVTQTKVLRVWVAPWVDKGNDLHWPGLMFVKIQKSEWNYGDNNFEMVEPPVPHLIPSIISQQNAAPQ